MSNEILDEGFFSNKNIPISGKVGLIALLLGGTYEKNAMSFNGKEQFFISKIYHRSGGVTPVAFTYGHPYSMSLMSAKAIMSGLGISNEMLGKVVNGDINDKEFVEYLAELYRTNPNIDKTKFGENFNEFILPKIKDYFDVLKNKEEYFAKNPTISDGIIATCTDVNIKDMNNDKKKQVTEQVTQTMTNNSQNN